MHEYLRNYFIAFAVFIPIDFLWFGVLMKKFYLGELAPIAKMQDGKFKPNMIAGVLAWAVIPLGIVFFAVPHLTPEASVLDAIGWGGLLGVVTYGIYDMTNLSTLRDYTMKLALVDWAWGTVLTAIITTVIWLIAK